MGGALLVQGGDGNEVVVLAAERGGALVVGLLGAVVEVVPDAAGRIARGVVVEVVPDVAGGIVRDAVDGRAAWDFYAASNSGSNVGKP